MKEIGGYLELENFNGFEYYDSLIKLNTGRNALIYILKAKKIKKIFIPYYLCSSISNHIEEYNIDYDYYHIDKNFRPKFERKLSYNECVLIVNYFGQITNEIIIQLKEKYENVIVDNTQAFFQKPIEEIDTIYSCRKFFGVPDGAYLSTNVLLNEQIEQDISKDRIEHILGRYEGQATDYYESFKKNDELFKNEPIKKMSKLTQNLLKAIDYGRVCKIRNKNFKFLHENLKQINKLNLIIPEGAFAYPLYMENGIEIRKVLAEKRIYIPILWPNVISECHKESIEYKYASNILPLPCDQRYNLDDMKFIIQEVLNCIS